MLVVLFCLSLAGLLSPWLSRGLGFLSDTPGKLAWIVDLASHFQWFFLGGCLLAIIVLGSANHRWYLGLLVLTLPWLTAVSEAPWAMARHPATFTVASTNLWVGNRNLKTLAGWVSSARPDVVLALELNYEAADQMTLWSQYPYKKLIPADDGFGVGLLSRFPILESRTVPDDLNLPRLEAKIQLPEGPVDVIAFHPMPPYSPSAQAARDAGLRAAAEDMVKNASPGLIAGDFNATPWSYAMNAPIKAGLRRATGFAPTWPVMGKGILGIPIDQMLVSHHWHIVERTRGPDIGSDHLPILVRLALVR